MKNDEVKTWMTLINALMAMYFGSYILAGIVLSVVTGIVIHVFRRRKHIR